ncbi:aldose 1-epimerase [Natronobacillus azotifigens]|uniref:Aldose 1-epimerase n=1 Tax=Natronobacillus azotifigens TaxID=472978 RepID=A0A9J6RAY1_9BACI|nr:aldose epimerase family protein [Natronobacillus azotifigens]MCZ0702483.1 galactose mutarotase [Natronobacillus azotifigens]
MQTNAVELTVDGQKWTEYTLLNDNGMEVSFLDYGGIITKMVTPDRLGTLENVVIGYKNYEDYLKNPNFFGALIGRVAGRIEGSRFALDGIEYQLPTNEGRNHLHGGEVGFHQVLWQVELVEHATSVGAILHYTTSDGDGGYPGNVAVKVTYTLTNDNQFTIDYEAVSDKKTVLTLTNHAYFNLSGNLKQDILHHEVTMDVSRFVELDDELIPTGTMLPVDGTVFDFRAGRLLKDGVDSGNPQNAFAKNGYDHYFLFDHTKEDKVVVHEQTSGRVLRVKTDQPGIVMYTSNGLDDSLSLRERSSAKYLGVCLETQSSPASLEHEGFPSIVLEKNKMYQASTTFDFGVK